jgi:hypothetical protein
MSLFVFCVSAESNVGLSADQPVNPITAGFRAVSVDSDGFQDIYHVWRR